MERGEFEIIVPPEELRPFVRRYLYANRKLEAGATFNAKPTGYAYFSNFFGAQGGDYGIIDGRRFKRENRWSFFGQITDHDVAFYHAQSLQLIAGELTATAHHRLFGISGSRVLGLAAPLEEVAPEAALIARECFALGTGASRDDHVEEANTFVSRLAARALPEDPVVERAVAMIEAANGAIRVADISREIGVGERQLNRRFNQFVGLSPKYYARILQINWVVGLLYANDAARLSEIAQEAGFYDQAHFNRAMQRFFREGPREFLRSDHPAFRSFLAASRRFGPDTGLSDD